MLLRSPLLSALPYVSHGFSTRLGGVSQGSRATLNLAGTDDAPEHVRENRRRFARQLGFDGPEDLIQVDQVHGARIVPAAEARGCEADGIISTEPGQLVGVRTADCAPVLLVATDAARRPLAVAAVHAGWRGATGGVVQAGVRALTQAGALAPQIFAAIGPTIGVDSFEVGEEVVEAARAALGAPPKTRPGPRGRPHLDLPDLVRRLLMQSGLQSRRIDVSRRCTFAQPGLFYSYRRDGAQSGRHLSAVALGARA